MNSEGVTFLEEAVSMQRHLSASLYWYVEKSLEDMLEGYMILMNEEQDGSFFSDGALVAEANQLITQMMELPLEFDSTSRHLSVSLIIAAIQNHIKSPKACKYLLVSMLKRKSEIAGILKSDFLTVLEHIFFREVKKEEYLKVEASMKELPKNISLSRWSAETDSTEKPMNPRLEGRAYAEILVELYQKEFVNATNVLVYLEQLSNLKEPSYYHTDLLLFLMSKIGSSVENKLSRGSCILRSSYPSTPTSSSTSFSGSRATFDGIYRRLDSLLPYAISMESKKAYEKIMEDRKQTKMRKNAKRTRSKDGFKNVCVYRGHQNKTSSIATTPTSTSSDGDDDSNQLIDTVSDEEAVTAL